MIKMNEKEFEKMWSEAIQGSLKRVFFGKTSFMYGDEYHFSIRNPNQVRIIRKGLASGVISLSRIKRII